MHTAAVASRGAHAMPGVFSKWQPEYAEAGIITFPVDGKTKKPAVSNYLRAGSKASAQWADKFPDADALGFACGARNGVTVLDIDAADEKLLVETLDKFGPTPVIIRTASGKYHGWYRYDCERRRIRPFPDKPIDILGGGFALAPPSLGQVGGYEFIAGSLADLPNLPTMRLVPELKRDLRAATTVETGERNNHLFRACLQAAASQTVNSEGDLMRYASELNASGSFQPLPPGEVKRTVASAWRYEVEGRNWVGSGHRVILDASEIELLQSNPDAMYLYTLLKMKHWGRDFVCSNAYAEKLPCGGWTLRRFRAARNFLVDEGLIVAVRPASFNRGPTVYRLQQSSPLSELARKEGERV